MKSPKFKSPSFWLASLTRDSLNDGSFTKLGLCMPPDPLGPVNLTSPAFQPGGPSDHIGNSHVKPGHHLWSYQASNTSSHLLGSVPSFNMASIHSLQWQPKPCSGPVSQAQGCSGFPGSFLGKLSKTAWKLRRGNDLWVKFDQRKAVFRRPLIGQSWDWVTRLVSFLVKLLPTWSHIPLRLLSFLAHFIPFSLTLGEHSEFPGIVLPQ